MSDSSLEKNQTELQHTLSRRDFARRAGLAAAAAAIAPARLLSQDAAPKPAASSDKPPQSNSGLSPELDAEGELKYQWLIERYGNRLSDAQKKDVHRLIMEGQKPLAAFRAFPLANADQPATVLKFTDAEDPANRGPQ
jgi:hypothetical protein